MVSNALPRNKNIFNHTRRALAAQRVLSFSWTISYRVGLSVSTRYDYRLELFSVVWSLPVPEVWYRRYLYGPHALSLFIYITCFYSDSIPFIKGIKYNSHFNPLVFPFHHTIDSWYVPSGRKLLFDVKYSHLDKDFWIKVKTQLKQLRNFWIKIRDKFWYDLSIRLDYIKFNIIKTYIYAHPHNRALISTYCFSGASTFC